MRDRVSAVPHLLLGHARVAGDIADDLRRAAAELGGALGAVPSHGRPVHDVGAEVVGLATRVTVLGEFLHAVGAAFAAAGAEGAGGVFTAAMSDVDGALTAQWRPRERLVPMDGATWWRTVWGNACYSGDRFYAGKGHGIVGPDGRRYPLVSPSVVVDGRVYNADWGRDGAPRVGDLLGADPGWSVVDIETGVERHRGDPSFAETLMVGIGSTVQGPPNRSREDDVEAVVLEPGHLPRLALVPAAVVAPTDLPSLPTAEERSIAAGQLAPTVLAGVAGVLEAGDGTHHAYQVVFEENADGRRRATYLRVDLTPGTGSEPPMLASTHVLGPDTNDRAWVRYLGPEGDSGAPTHPQVEIFEPAKGTIDGDR